MDSRGTVILLRTLGGLLIAAAIGIAIGMGTVMGGKMAEIILVAAGLALPGIGAGIGLIGIAALFNQRRTGPEELLRNVRTLQAQVHDLSAKVDDIGVTMDRHSRPRAPLAVETPAPIPSESLASIQDAIAELRTLTLFTDDQRREHTLQLKAEQKLLDIHHAIECIERREWSQAQYILQTVESQWPGDATIARAKSEFEQARLAAEAESIAATEASIESDMSLGRWDEAMAAAHKLAADFPSSASALNLLTRVQREKGIYVETTVARLFDEIRHNIERREWRRALTTAQRLLEKFPDHSKSEKIRQQLKTIQDNAEIEERQQQEVRIGELIRARRFNEAIQLGEDLLHRFPMSPQAEAIEVLLPRIKALAAEAEESTPSI